MLSGIVFDANGVRFTPTHAVKNGKRYRYYTSQAAIQHKDNGPTVARFPAQELDNLVISQIHLLLASPDKFLCGLEDSPEKDVAEQRARDLAKRWPRFGTSEQHEFVRNTLRRVVVGQSTIRIEIDEAKLVESLLGRKLESVTVGERRLDTIKLTADFQPLRRGGELRLVESKGTGCEGTPTRSLVKAVARARDWYEQIIAGEVGTVGHFAKKTGLPGSYVKRILKCPLLSPEITENVLSGNHPPTLTLQELLQKPPIDWKQQNQEIRSPRSE